MAHNIEIKKVNGVEVASFVENGRKERAWHGLGQVFDGQLSVKEAMEKGVGQEYGERGTAMWAINGLTTYYQNVKNFRDDEAKFTNIMQGTAALKVQKFHDLAMAI